MTKQDVKKICVFLGKEKYLNLVVIDFDENFIYATNSKELVRFSINDECAKKCSGTYIVRGAFFKAVMTISNEVVFRGNKIINDEGEIFELVNTKSFHNLLGVKNIFGKRTHIAQIQKDELGEFLVENGFYVKPCALTKILKELEPSLLYSVFIDRQTRGMISIILMGKNFDYVFLGEKVAKNQTKKGNNERKKK